MLHAVRFSSYLHWYLSTGVGKSTDRPLKMASSQTLFLLQMFDLWLQHMFLNENFLLKPTLWQYLQYNYCWWTVLRTSEIFQGFVGVFMGCSLSWICGGRSLCWSNYSVAWFCIVSNSVPLCCLCSMSIKILNGYYKNLPNLTWCVSWSRFGHARVSQSYERSAWCWA